MPRGPREWSSTGFYHVVIKGNAGLTIFESDADRYKFIDILSRYRDEMGMSIIAWCLMSNHVHLVLDSKEQELGPFMKKIEVSYVQFFNRQEVRTGHLFQNRFFSKPIESDAQLLATVDYIHRNPERARICAKEDYPWSSYSEYTGSQWISDVDLILSLVGGIEGFRKYVGSQDDVVMVSKRRAWLSDEQVLELMKQRLGEDSVNRLRGRDQKERNSVFVALSDLGVPVLQMARISGFGEATVRRALRNH